MDPPVKADRRQHAGEGECDSPYGLRRFTAAAGTERRAIRCLRAAPVRRTGCLFMRQREAPHAVSFPAGKQQAPALKSGKGDADRGGQVERFSGPHDQRELRRGCGAGTAPPGGGRSAALHQPGRQRTGDVHRLRRLERGGREGGTVHVPQLFRCRAGPRTSDSRCSAFPGICRWIPCRTSMRATRRARKSPAGSGSRFSPSRSARATWKSRTHFWTRW